jgi:hypothetical protein
VGGESYTALAQGLQEALQRLGGVPTEHRTDSLSAAYKNLSKDEQEDMTQRYQALCEHFSMKATRNNVGLGHENGGIESPHGHVKRRIEQALLIRGSNDFDTIEAYQCFIDDVVKQHNQRNAKAIDIERQSLQALPKNKAIDYTEVQAVVSSSSTIDVRKVTYTVPSQLQGETLHIRLYDHSLVCYLGSQHVITLPRVYPADKTGRARRIDYRHVIHSLVKKPQAFRYSQIRNDLLPGLGYKVIWAYVDSHMEPRAACKFMVGLLYLAATQNCEKALTQTVLENIDDGVSLSLSTLQARFQTVPTAESAIAVEQHPLQHYNRFIPQYQEVSHV